MSCASERHIPAPPTLTNTWSGKISGTLMSSSSSGLLYPYILAASIVCFLRQSKIVRAPRHAGQHANYDCRPTGSTEPELLRSKKSNYKADVRCGLVR